MVKPFNPGQYVTKNLDRERVEKLKEVFDLFDYDGSGTISNDEFVNTIKALDVKDNAEAMIEALKAKNAEGDIDFATFVSVIAQFQPQKEGEVEQPAFGQEQFAKICGENQGNEGMDIPEE